MARGAERDKDDRMPWRGPDRRVRVCAARCMRGQVGLASVSLAVQRSGGSVAHPGAALDLRLEELAAAVEAGAGPQVR